LIDKEITLIVKRWFEAGHDFKEDEVTLNKGQEWESPDGNVIVKLEDTAKPLTDDKVLNRIKTWYAVQTRKESTPAREVEKHTLETVLRIFENETKKGERGE
jgi:hypothetical protein